MSWLSRADIRRILILARAELAAHEAALNTLNVYPIPDGDTGTNMRSTLDAGFAATRGPNVEESEALDAPHSDSRRAKTRGAEVSTPEHADPSPSDPPRKSVEARSSHEADAGAAETSADEPFRFVQGLTLGAQGNSGAILAEFLRAASMRLTSPRVSGSHGPAASRRATESRDYGFDAHELVLAFEAGAQAARMAVGDPQPGTILSVADAAASAARKTFDAAVASDRDSSQLLIDIALNAERAASQRLEDGMNELASLRAAGVVDSGGAGLLIILDALARVVSGVSGLPASRSHLSAKPRLGLLGEESPADISLCDGGESERTFELMAVITNLQTDSAVDGQTASSSTPDTPERESHDAPEGTPRSTSPQEISGGDPGARQLRDSLKSLGDSLVVAGASGTYRIHIHTDSVLAAASRLRALGTVKNVSITRFAGVVPALNAVRVRVQDQLLSAYAKALGAVDGGSAKLSAKAEDQGNRDPESASPAIAQEPQMLGSASAHSATGANDALVSLGEGKLIGPAGAACVIDMLDEALLDPEQDVEGLTSGLDVWVADGESAVRAALEQHAASAERVVALVPPEASIDIRNLVADALKNHADASLFLIDGGHDLHLGVE